MREAGAAIISSLMLIVPVVEVVDAAATWTPAGMELVACVKTL